MKITKKLIVWDLCGGSQNSVYNGLGWDDRFIVYTFDLVEPQRKGQYQIDLSKPGLFVKLVNEKNIPNPDIIVASPLCNSFSHILNCGDKNHNERLGWKYSSIYKQYVIRDEKEIIELSKNNNFLKNTGKYPEKVIERCLIGQNLLYGIITIINYYKPTLWYIENPEKSLMWDFIRANTDFYNKWNVSFNTTFYYCYDLNFSKKPTAFLSNAYLDLKRYTIKNTIFQKSNTRSKINNYGNSKSGETGANVKIPERLIQDIFNQFYELYFNCSKRIKEYDNEN